MSPSQPGRCAPWLPSQSSSPPAPENCSRKLRPRCSTSPAPDVLANVHEPVQPRETANSKPPAVTATEEKILKSYSASCLWGRPTLNSTPPPQRTHRPAAAFLPLRLSFVHQESPQ